MGDAANLEVSGLSHDSRRVEMGFVYIAIKGQSHDGHDFLSSAIERGAIALVVEDLGRVPEGFDGSVVEVENGRAALFQLASRWFGEPAQDLFCIGVTGTNGKTTVSYLVEHLLNSYGWETGVLGTIDHHLKDKSWNSSLTTPDALTLQGRLRDFQNLGAQAAVFEVSSHALEQKRSDGIPFNLAVFTNLSRDHLDYHKSMEDYFRAKARLFTEVLQLSTKNAKKCILNIDDEWGRRLHQMVPTLCWTYGQNQDADFQFTVKGASLQGSAVSLVTPRGAVEFTVPLVGEHNVYNAVAAMAVGVFAGAGLETLAKGIESFEGVPGRMQAVSFSDRAPFVFVDYAHTPDALKRALSSLRQELEKSDVSGSRLIVVFGCGGDRDRGKRPLMGHVASELADQIILTSDNPRSEPEELILNEIAAGLEPQGLQGRLRKIPSRKDAIASALQMAKEDDVILIAGKGHEDTQMIRGETLDFSDVEVVRQCFAELFY